MEVIGQYLKFSVRGGPAGGAGRKVWCGRGRGQFLINRSKTGHSKLIRSELRTPPAVLIQSTVQVACSVMSWVSLPCLLLLHTHTYDTYSVQRYIVVHFLFYSPSPSPPPNPPDPNTMQLSRLCYESEQAARLNK